MQSLTEQDPLNDIGFVRLYNGDIRPSRRHGTIAPDCGVVLNQAGDLTIVAPTGRSIFALVEGDIIVRRK